MNQQNEIIHVSFREGGCQFRQAQLIPSQYDQIITSIDIIETNDQTGDTLLVMDSTYALYLISYNYRTFLSNILLTYGQHAHPITSVARLKGDGSQAMITDSIGQLCAIDLQGRSEFCSISQLKWQKYYNYVPENLKRQYVLRQKGLTASKSLFIKQLTPFILNIWSLDLARQQIVILLNLDLQSISPNEIIGYGLYPRADRFMVVTGKALFLYDHVVQNYTRSRVFYSNIQNAWEQGQQTSILTQDNSFQVYSYKYERLIPVYQTDPQATVLGFFISEICIDQPEPPKQQLLFYGGDQSLYSVDLETYVIRNGPCAPTPASFGIIPPHTHTEKEGELTLSPRSSHPLSHAPTRFVALNSAYLGPSASRAAPLLFPALCCIGQPDTLTSDRRENQQFHQEVRAQDSDVL